MLEARALGFAHPEGPPLFTDATLAIAPGEIVGLHGPSGIGKSTLGRLLSGHLAPGWGAVLLDGAPLRMAGFCPVQYLGQSPMHMVNPRWRVGAILSEASAPEPKTLAALGIAEGWSARYPHELSGGQLQRVAIARALAPGLRFLVADEISTMLDAITQAEIWAFLTRLAAERGIGILAISHDRALLEAVATRTLEFREIALGP
ncbi:ABC transporter ATP-binding protein [Arsenicitalea aurantiaca]|nr:ATP-binding cassette domain-containing protein [Arsenicitalea aurantiaca]